MFDAAILDRVFDRFEAMARDGQRHAAAFGELPELPGPDLAAGLDLCEPDSRADDELIDRIGSWEKLRAWVDAGQLGDIAELTRRRRHTDELQRAAHAARGGQGESGYLMEFVADEIALAARISRVAAGTRLDLAQDLTASLPQVFTALRSGQLDLGRARIISEGTRTLDKDARVTVAERVLVKAATNTASALRAAVARAVHIIDPGGADDRHKRDLTDRKVILTPRENGMSELWAFLPADGAAAIMATLHRLGQASNTPADHGAGDHRSADQRRADALIDLATSYLDTHPALHKPRDQEAGGATTPRSGRRPPAWAQVQVVLPANLLTGAGSEPAELLGYGPIPTSMALTLAADATWQRLLTDPATGALTDVGRQHYTPPAVLAQHLITRDRRCRFPGCRQPRTDLDHTLPYPAGPTTDYNLTALCRHHHRAKQHPHWQAHPGPGNALTWTTPTGHTHTTHPPPPVEPAGPSLRVHCSTDPAEPAEPAELPPF